MGGITLWEFGLRIVVLYALVMVALRLMGKREIGQLSVFDFVVSVMIAELSTLPMEQIDVPVYRSIFAISTLVLLQLVVAMVSLKSHRFRHWVEGEVSVLIEHGRIKDKELRKTRYSMHDLMMQLRQKGFANVADVEFAILETSGDLSVFPTPEKQPLTASSIGQRVTDEIIPLPLVIDGTPVKKTLQAIHKDENWLASEIQRRGYKTFGDVFYAAIDGAGNIFIDGRDATPKDNTYHPKTE